MTLDPVHVDEIAALARLIDRDVDATDHDDFAETVWEEWLDPLTQDGRTLLEPVDKQYSEREPVDAIGLIESPFPQTHGIDAGTLNPTTFRNGAVIDVAHAAMASEPSSHDLHRHRSIVGTIHLADSTVHIPDTWHDFDAGYSRRKWVPVPQVSRFVEGVVHSLALYYAESQHAHEHLEAVSDLLILDGPIYPKEILRWQDRHEELRKRLLADVLPGEVVQSYIDLIGACLERSLPLIGFVKNPSSNRLTRALRSAGAPAPWFNDAALFRRVLTPDSSVSDPEKWLCYTNWFISRAGTDGTFAAGTQQELPLEFPDPEWRFCVTFMVVYDPRDDAIYRIEAPHGVTADDSMRERLTQLILREVAGERGPPRAVQKADSLARIGRGEKESLRRVIEGEWETQIDRTYDDRRWGGN